MSAFALKQQPVLNQPDVVETCLQSSEQYALARPSIFCPNTSVSNATLDNIASFDAHMVTKPVMLTEVSNATVFLSGSRYAVRTSDGQLIAMHGLDEKRLSDIAWQSHRHLPGTSIVFGNTAGAGCYYHWMLDVLPKLGYLQRSGFNLDNIDHFLIRGLISPFQLQSLKKLGIDESRIRETGKHPFLTCDKAMLVHLEHQVNLTMNRFVPEWINEQFGQLANQDTKASERIKLFIKRPDGVRRGIQNSEQVEQLLLNHGFQVAEMEGLSITEQAHLLSRADVVVATHGAALTNIVFAQPGTKVLELFGAHVYPFYYGLANLCQLQYHALLQDVNDYPMLVQKDTALMAGTAAAQAATAAKDFTIDVVELEKVLNAI